MAWDFWPLPMAEPDTLHDELLFGFDVTGIASSGKYAPFFFHANRNGDISTAPYSGNIAVWFGKEPTRPNRWFDYDFRIDLTERADTKKIIGYFRQFYAHIRLYIIDITAGITPLVYGAQDPTLSSGGFLFSGNAYPIPHVTIGIDRYTAIPGLYGYLKIKGGLTHGWFADNSVLDTTYATISTLLHHKFAGLQFGSDRWPVNIAYEIHHAAQWGGTSPDYGRFGTNWESYKNIFLVRSGGNNLSDQLNAEGNHIGWQEVSLSVHTKEWQAALYWQAIFEDKSAAFIGSGMNAADGLWGIHLKQSAWPYINGMTYECLNTTSQSGPFHDKDGIIYAGRDSYFYNTSYRQGWTHFDRTIGSPYLRPDNNRVRMHFVGLSGDIVGFRYRFMASYTRNWGTYQEPAFSKNTALLLEIKKNIPKAWGLDFGLSIGADIGNQFGNTVGAMFTLSKRGVLFSYR